MKKDIDSPLLAILDNTKRSIEGILDQSYRLRPKETGLVTSVGGGIVRIKGLQGVRLEELVGLSGGKTGLAYTLEPDEVSIILLDDETGIEAGSIVYRTGRILEVPVGDMLIGRVTDALGRPLDEKGEILTSEFLPVERPAPPIMHRAPVDQPLQTGILAIDALLAIGKGQRELILGDRKTGKTALAVDAIINQRNRDVICIYCAIGKQKASIARVIADLEKYGAMEYTLVVAASGDTPIGLQYVAPYAATSMAEYFMKMGKDVLIVYDDLTWHARAYRQLALLMRRPPGREAYPGDIFYLHARLLERATHLKDAYGGGSLTAIPILETQAQNITAFIPTNLISICDGQIYVSPDLFENDQLPAVEIGLSVSRVGGAAQLPAYRNIVKQLKISYSQFEELESFARFSTRLDEQTRTVIERGKRIRGMLRQIQFDVMPVMEQIVLLFAVTEGLLDHIDVLRIPEAQLRIRKAAGEALQDLAIYILDGHTLRDDHLQLMRTTIAFALSSMKTTED